MQRFLAVLDWSAIDFALTAIIEDPRISSDAA